MCSEMTLQASLRAPYVIMHQYQYHAQIQVFSSYPPEGEQKTAYTHTFAINPTRKSMTKNKLLPYANMFLLY